MNVTGPKPKGAAKRKLKELRAFINKVPESNLCMETFISRTSPYSPATDFFKPNCGTTCCIGGFMVVKEKPATDIGLNGRAMTLARTEYGLDVDQIDELFTAIRYRRKQQNRFDLRDPYFGKARILNVLDNLIETGTVDWGAPA